MSANVETMFYVRERPWHGLGTEVSEAPDSLDALIYAGLDWRVEQKKVCTEEPDREQIPGPALFVCRSRMLTGTQ